jgi:hypothetical protein
MQAGRIALCMFALGVLRDAQGRSDWCNLCDLHLLSPPSSLVPSGMPERGVYTKKNLTIRGNAWRQVKIGHYSVYAPPCLTIEIHTKRGGSDGGRKADRGS